MFRAAGLWDRRRVVLEVSLFYAIEEFVRRGVGVAVTPCVAGWKPGAGVQILPAAHLFPSDELLLLRRRGMPRQQAQLLEELLRRPPA